MPVAAQDAMVGSGGDNPARNEQKIEAIRRYVDQLLQSAAFRGSHRSQQFLRYIVEKTLNGDAESLKERTIGVELFQRPATYDTGQDAIVRVTATEVRRRLLQHYGCYGDASPFHISLPAGSYLPEIEIQPSALAEAESRSEPVDQAETARPTEQIEISHAAKSALPETARPAHPRWTLWTAGAIGVVAGILIAAAFAQMHRWEEPTPISALPPWTAVFRLAHATQIITSDPNIEQLQELTGHNISASDYADHLYVPAGRELSPAQREFYQYYEHADNAAAVDTPLAVSIARLAPPDFPVQSRSARSLRITDLQTDDNLVLIGSPRSNPWVGLFADQLDFRFVFDPEVNQEIIVNPHPRPGEESRYVPTARGFATGDSYALIAVVHNQNQSGRVLLLAGANGEGTEAAGHAVTDRDHLLRLLQECGVPQNGLVPDFELLLRLRTVAGSPNTVNLVVCHILSGQKPE